MYRTADDRWLILVFVIEDKQVPPFLKAIGHPEAAEDPRYADTRSRRAHASEIAALLDKTFATRPLAEWRELLDTAGLTYGVVQTRGIVPPEGGIVRLPDRIPRNIALELLLTGDPLPAERAERFGLVNHLTEPGEALKGALELAARIARNAPLAVAAVKPVVDERTAFGDQEAFHDQDRIVGPVLSSQDAQEGARAFAEKRRPRWQGR